MPTDNILDDDLREYPGMLVCPFGMNAYLKFFDIFLQRQLELRIDDN
jgi:hypothetical protein